MTRTNKPRLRFFESSPAQRHIKDDDKYIYAHDEPRYRLNVIGTGTIGHEHMRVATMLGEAAVYGIFDTQPESVAAAAENFSTYSDQPLVSTPWMGVSRLRFHQPCSVE